MQNCNCGGQTVSIGKCDIDVRACFFFNSTGDMTSKKATFRAFATDVSGGTPGKMVSACCFTNATNAGIVMVERCVLVVCARCVCLWHVGMDNVWVGMRGGWVLPARVGVMCAPMCMFDVLYCPHNLSSPDAAQPVEGCADMPVRQP